MTAVETNGVELACEFHGPENGPVILMIMGLGLPAAAWPPALIDLLAGAGYRVLTFDNRDIGRSSRLDGLGVPKPMKLAIRHLLGLPMRVPYTLDDMTRDTEGLLAALGIPEAHVVGASMGGMIAQKLALGSPGVVRSLTSISSTTNDRHLPQPAFRVKTFIARGPRDSSEAARREYHRRLWPLIGSPGYPHSEQALSEFVERIFASGIRSAGVARQTAAVIAEPGRSAALAGLRVPTLVIHGRDDPLVRAACGRRTAESIPGAELMLVDGMGHDLPPALVPVIGARIVRHVGRHAGSERAA